MTAQSHDSQLCSCSYLVLATLLVIFLYVLPTYAQTQPTGVMYPRDASPAAGTTSITTQGNLVYHGGPVMANSTTYAIWWGNPSDFPPDAIAGVDRFLDGLNGSAYLSIADQYMFGVKTTTSFGGNYFYSQPPDPPSVLADPAKVQQHIGYEFCNTVLPRIGLKADPNAIYLLYTSNFPGAETTYCAFHTSGSCTATSPVIQFAYLPNSTSVGGCSAEAELNTAIPYLLPNAYSAGTRSVVNSTAHEFMEIITDPLLNAWWEPATGNEVGDSCDWVFQNTVPLTNSNWELQEIWSNQTSGCAQGAPQENLLGAISNAKTVTTFNIPGATYGIFGTSLSGNGTVAGTYYDSNYFLPFASFVRTPLGAVTTFNVSGASRTFAKGINSNGATAGTFSDAQGAHGFVRDPMGNITTFDVSTAKNGTRVDCINSQGMIGGSYTDASGVTHGFVRDPLGNINTFDGPALPYETVARSVNDGGVVAGYYAELNQPYHGFLRDSLGNITSFDVPDGLNGTEGLSINLAGAVAGTYTDANFVKHAFIRSPSGTFTTFDAPGAMYGTIAYSINKYGAVAGYFSDSNGASHGFVRDQYGHFTVLSEIPSSINDNGMTTGYAAASLK